MLFALPGSDFKVPSYLEEAQKLKSHEMRITSMWLLKNQSIASAGNDCVVCIHNALLYKKIRVLRNHERWINCLAEKEGILISGSLDKTFIFWDISKNF